MTRKLTITVSDEVYAALYHDVGRGRIAGFVERHLRPHLRLRDDHEREYAAYADWLDSKDGEAETAEMDDWLASDAATDREDEQDRWPDAWYRKAGLAKP